MVFGTFTLTGDYGVLSDSPPHGYLIITSIPKEIPNLDNGLVFVSPKHVYLRADGTFSVQLPTNSTTGNSTTVGYRVTSNFKGIANITPKEFYAPQIGSTLNIASLTVAVVEPIGDTAANVVLAQQAQASAEDAAADVLAYGATQDTVVQGFVNDPLSLTRAALTSLISSQASGGDVSTAQLTAAINDVLEAVPSNEELKTDIIINFPAEANPINLATSTTRELPIFGAAFPCRILSLDFWWNTSIASDAANYVNVKVERTLANGTEDLVGQQSTAQKAIVADNHWSFSQPLDETFRVLPYGAHLGLQLETTGDIADLNGPHLVSIRYARA